MEKNRKGGRPRTKPGEPYSQLIAISCTDDQKKTILGTLSPEERAQGLLLVAAAKRNKLVERSLLETMGCEEAGDEND